MNGVSEWAALATIGAAVLSLAGLVFRFLVKRLADVEARVATLEGEVQKERDVKIAALSFIERISWAWRTLHGHPLPPLPESLRGNLDASAWEMQPPVAVATEEDATK